jgi:hypothetical protein
VPDVWEEPLAYLDVSEGNMLRLRGLLKELCDPNERITDMSGFGLDVANRVRSDVAGVRQVGMPPAIDSSGMPLPEGGEGNAVGKGEGSGGSGEGDGSAAELGRLWGVRELLLRQGARLGERHRHRPLQSLGRRWGVRVMLLCPLAIQCTGSGSGEY